MFYYIYIVDRAPKALLKGQGKGKIAVYPYCALLKKKKKKKLVKDIYFP